MEIAGIQFAPLKIPFERRLQTLAAGLGFLWLVFGGFICLFFTVYLVLFTRFCYITLLYILWMVLYDLKISERGGRPSKWVRSWKWWKYMKDYFPVRLERMPWAELDPKKNYLFCCFPHGIASLGVFCSFCTEYGEYKTYFPHHQVRVVALSQHYLMPFFREMTLGLGGIASDARSIEHVLQSPEGGHVCVLIPGGAQETYYCKPGQYKTILRKRKGFVRVALKNGTPLVPVLSFGETDTFDQIQNDTLRKIQEFIRKYIGMAPALPIGRGFFQYTFGVIPRRTPICVLVGQPMEVPKIENPTSEEINEYHKQFVQRLQDMFEEQKYNYVEDPENTKLILE